MTASAVRLVHSWIRYTARVACQKPQATFIAQPLHIRTRGFATSLREHLKDEAKRRKTEARLGGHTSLEKGDGTQRTAKWELTVGIEVHAELNTAHKLFSTASTASADYHSAPNTDVALFDAGTPGSQPQLQWATLLPAIRAALGLGCKIQGQSGWDRKHYFHWDQPNGYQITQYYAPFAKDGVLAITAEDGVPAADLNGASSINIGIKQVQMEQDTAKTTHHPPSTYHVDLNRAGHPLIEIITLPQIHSPQTAAAVVRKIQAVLKSVDACITGMELGGLRADVNVSVRQRGTSGHSSYSGVSGLGQRTEIKNLSSFAAIESAIVAERKRQISVLESGGVVEGETRGWTLGATETTRLRGKEGEVDYRYMPDPDLAPLFIGQDIVDHLRATLPELPEETERRIPQQYGLSAKDAKTLVALDNGDRLEFLEITIDLVEQKLSVSSTNNAKVGKTVGNWVLHELGGLLTTSGTGWSSMSITPAEVADILVSLLQREITARTAKLLLTKLHELPVGTSRPSVLQLIDEGNLRLRPLSDAEYAELAMEVMSQNPQMVAAAKQKGQKGKVMWFVGQMVRSSEEGTVEPERAKQVLEHLLST